MNCQVSKDFNPVALGVKNESGVNKVCEKGSEVRRREIRVSHRSCNACNLFYYSKESPIKWS